MATLGMRPSRKQGVAQSALTRYRFTPEAFHRLAATGVFPPEARLELIEGDIYTVPPEGPDHTTTRLRTVRSLSRRASNRWHVRTEALLQLSDSEPVPDVSIVKGDEETIHSLFEPEWATRVSELLR